MRVSQTATTALLAMIATVAFCAVAPSAWALPVQVVHTDISPHCDFLSIPFDVDELGSPATPFPPDELIDHIDRGQGPPVCDTNDPSVVDALVEITNLTTRNFTEVWYIADPETSITNFDGLADDALGGGNPEYHAFRIDNDASDPGGVHHPLVFESIGPANGVFEAGETWQFVLQDYFNALGIPPDQFVSFRVGSASMDLPGALTSSGSIVAIPEPTGLVLLAMTCLCTLCCTRRSGV